MISISMVASNNLLVFLKSYLCHRTHRTQFLDHFGAHKPACCNIVFSETINVGYKLTIEKKTIQDNLLISS